MNEMILKKLDAGEVTVNGQFIQGAKTTVAKTSVTLAVAHGTNYDGSVTQPANTTIKDIFVIPQATITSSGASGDGLDISVGAASSFTDIIAAKELLDDGGSAVTMSKGMVLPIVKDFVGAGSNAHAPQGLATSEAIVIAAGGLTTTAERTVNVRFDPIDADLGAAGDVDVVFVFAHAE
jgi:hypothetical protein|tara:strand:- start:113 stop:649 length:537 start_codon:yes stop_codon:yes gene_type:complete